MVVDTSQPSDNNVFNSTLTIDPSSCLGKISSDNKVPFATCMDVNLLTGCKKYLKSSLAVPSQSYLHIAIDQEKGDKNYQHAYKDKLGKIIQSLLSTDETVAIVKYSEHVVKIQIFFVVLEEDSLTNATQLPHSLTKTQQCFYRGKPKPNDSKVYTNVRILHAIGIQDIVGDLRHELEVEGVTVGLQRVQHHDVVKVGYVYGMMENIDTKEWTDKVQIVLLQVLQCKPELSLQGSKIYDGNYSRDANDLQFRILSHSTPKNMAIDVETIGPQKIQFEELLQLCFPN